MSDEKLDAQFKDLLRRKQDRDAKTRAAFSTKREKEERLLAQYRNIRDDVVVPALREVVDIMRGNAHDGNVNIDETSGSVEFDLIVDQRPHSNKLRFSYKSTDGTISVTGPGVGVKSVPLAGATRDEIRQMAMAYLRVCIVGVD